MFSSALKTLSSLKEQLQVQEELVRTFDELVAYLMISVPNPEENSVVLQAIENREKYEEEKLPLVREYM